MPLDTANKNLILALQQMQPTGNPEIDAQWRYQVKQQFADNATRRRIIAAELEALATRVAQPTEVRQDLLDQLPTVQVDVLEPPEEHRRQQFDAFHLEISAADIASRSRSRWPSTPR